MLARTPILCVMAFAIVAGGIVAASAPPDPPNTKVSDTFSPTGLSSFTELEPTDTHAHVF